MLALSVCPLRGSQLPQRGSQGVRQSQPAKLHFKRTQNETDNHMPLSQKIRTGSPFWKNRFGFFYNCSTCSIQSRELASLGILQSPRGLRQTEPTLTPSGIQLRLNCWVKNLR